MTRIVTGLILISIGTLIIVKGGTLDFYEFIGNWRFGNQ